MAEWTDEDERQFRLEETRREMALERLQRLTKAMRARDRLIAEARETGITWEVIAKASGMTRVGAIRAAERWNSRKNGVRVQTPRPTSYRVK